MESLMNDLGKKTDGHWLSVVRKLRPIVIHVNNLPLLFNYTFSNEI